MSTTTVDAMQVGHSANMVAALADHLANDDLPKHVRHACGEAFMNNAALLATWIIETVNLAEDISQEDYEFLVTVEATTREHVTTYGEARNETPLIHSDYGAIRARMLPLALVAAGDAEPLRSYIAAAIAGEYPTE